jgi:malate synthase
VNASTVSIATPISSEDATLLTPEALTFVAELHDRFADAITSQVAARPRVFESGFRHLPETESIRTSAWQVTPPPLELQDRRVEITGPVDRKMVINALNSGANVYMADFEDSTCPTWRNVIDGQRNLFDAVRRTIAANIGGKSYRLNDKIAVLFVRPRGLHLPEAHIRRADGKAALGALVDFGLFAFHNAKELQKRGSGAYFYLPKLEHHLEARLWNQVMHYAEERLDLPRASLRCTVLIETLPAAFQMEEILFELRERSLGLNCGRWDYIFSFIKRQAHDPSKVVPDRGQLTMDRGFLKAYSQELIRVCHKRGAHAMGGMSAFIPIRSDSEANEQALTKVRADKEREVNAGHDGTWVAHPGLVRLAREIFDSEMPRANQLERPLPEPVALAELLRIPEGPRTRGAVRTNIEIGLSYLASWLGGVGCVPIHNLMEDAATAEISRTQLWQQLHHKAPFDDDSVLTASDVAELIRIEAEKRVQLAPQNAKPIEAAATLFLAMCTAAECPEFLTLAAYDWVVAEGG